MHAPRSRWKARYWVKVICLLWTETEHGFQPTITANPDGLFDGLVLSGTTPFRVRNPLDSGNKGIKVGGGLV